MNRPRLLATLAAGLTASGVAQADPPEPPPVPPLEIEVISFNTWGLPFPFSRGRRRGRLAETSGFLAQHQADIVGLQELFGRSRAYLEPGDYGVLAGEDLQTGLAVMSGWPVELRQQALFAPERQRDILTRKGFMHATVTLPNGVDLQVFVTHFDAGLAYERRQRAAVQLLEAVDQAGGPTIVLGDFNLSDDTRDTSTEARFAEAGWRDAGSEGGPTHRLFDERFDRIYLRDGDTWCVSTQDYAVLDEDHGADKGWSDHRPVWARVNVAGCPVVEPAAAPERSSQR
jgi:endonuclease/exonuclease/phosphatase family metal-dependent hydrolase